LCTSYLEKRAAPTLDGPSGVVQLVGHVVLVHGTRVRILPPEHIVITSSYAGDGCDRVSGGRTNGDARTPPPSRGARRRRRHPYALHEAEAAAPAVRQGDGAVRARCPGRVRGRQG